MKRKILSFLYVTSLCMFGVGFTPIFIEWMLTNKSIGDLSWLNAIKMGGAIGGIMGICLWLCLTIRYRR